MFTLEIKELRAAHRSHQVLNCQKEQVFREKDKGKAVFPDFSKFKYYLQNLELTETGLLYSKYDI